MSKENIYLDYASTSPVYSQVLEKMTLADWILGAVVVLLWNGYLIWKMKRGK